MDSELSKVIIAWHAAALDSAKWPSALTTLADFMGAVDCTLEIHHGPAKTPLFFSGGNRLPKEGMKAYLAHYASVCPRIDYIGAQPEGAVGYDHGFMSETEMDRDEFYADFLAPDDLRYFMSATLMNRANALNGFTAIHRSPGQGHATGRDVERLRRLVPHLGQALDTHMRLAAHTRTESCLLESLEQIETGILLLDAAGDLIFANTAAAAIAREDDGIGLSNRGPVIKDPAARRQCDGILAGFLADTLDASLRPGGQVFVPRPSGLPPYSLLIRRFTATGAILSQPGMAPAAMIFLHDPARALTPGAGYLAEAFGLTPREAELAIALYNGASLREHAVERGIRISTARYHLYHAMAKMGVRHQTHMIRLLARLIPPLN